MSSVRFVFNWKIENYDFCYLQGEEFIKSPEFTAGNILGTRWYLQFYPKNFWYVLQRCKQDSYEGKVKVGHLLEFISSGGECLASCDNVSSDLLLSNDEGFSNIICEPKDIKEIEDLTVKFITLRCTLVSKEIINDTSTGCNAKTNFIVERYLFSWDKADWTKGREFTLFDESRFKVDLKDESGGGVIVTISNHQKMAFAQLSQCNIILYDANGKEIISKNNFHLFKGSNENIWTFRLLDTTEQNKYSAYLKFEFRSSKCYKSILADYNYKNPITNTYAPLQDAFHALYVSKKHSDVQLTVGKETFPAHKLILAARSSVFSVMFDQDMLENRTANVDIEDSNPITVSSFLLFLYTGKLENMNYETALQLLIMADKYDVSSLLEQCSLFLTSIISNKNAFEILYTADLMQHKVLKTSAIDYIISNAAFILSSAEWKSWMENNCKLGNEVLCKMLPKLSL